MANNSNIWFAVVNPQAGSGKTLARCRKAESILFDKGIRYTSVLPETISDSDEKIREACIRGHRNFFAVGGDGTIHSVLNSIVRYVVSSKGTPSEVQLEEFTLVSLPIGSGNDWLRSHGVQADFKVITDMMAQGSYSFQDVVKAEIRDGIDGEVTRTAYMANVGGYNLDANICDVVNFQKAHGVTGKLIYVDALKKLAHRQKSHLTRILADGKEVFSGPLYSISIGNGKFSGGGLCQTPDAVMDDKLMDMVIVPKFPLWKVVFYIPKLLRKRIKEISILQFHKASSIEIIPEGQGQLVEIDGDIIGRAPVKFTIQEGRIRVLDSSAERRG